MVNVSFSGKRDSDYRWVLSALAGQGGGKVGFQCIPSWGWSGTLLAYILPHIFVFVFNLIRFFIVFFSISEGFGEAKMVQKSRFLLFFWICLWRPYFWSNFVRFLIKSMAKNIGIFSEFSTRRFINCFLNLLISSMHQLQCLYGLLRILQDCIADARPMDPAASAPDDPHIYRWQLLMQWPAVMGSEAHMGGSARFCRPAKIENSWYQ